MGFLVGILIFIFLSVFIFLFIVKKVIGAVKQMFSPQKSSNYYEREASREYEEEKYNSSQVVQSAEGRRRMEKLKQVAVDAEIVE